MGKAKNIAPGSEVSASAARSRPEQPEHTVKTQPPPRVVGRRRPAPKKKAVRDTTTVAPTAAETETAEEYWNMLPQYIARDAGDNVAPADDGIDDVCCRNSPLAAAAAAATDDTASSKLNLMSMHSESMRRIIAIEPTPEKAIVDYYLKTGQILFSHSQFTGEADDTTALTAAADELPDNETTVSDQIFGKVRRQHMLRENKRLEKELTNRVLQESYIATLNPSFGPETLNELAGRARLRRRGTPRPAATADKNDNVDKTDNDGSNENDIGEEVPSLLDTIRENVRGALPSEGAAETDALDFICDHCGVELTVDNSDAVTICPCCDRIEPLLTDGTRATLATGVREHVSYKRMNHFNEWLSKIQGKQRTEVPDAVYQLVVRELQKYGITLDDVDKITRSRIRGILKAHNLGNHYADIPFIVYHLTGRTGNTISKATEEQLRSLFLETLLPFHLFKLPSRKNFMSYKYVLHKLCQLLGHDELLEYFPILENPEKRRIQDEIWKKICEYNQWEFVPSL